MNRIELTYLIGEEAGIPKKEAKKALESLLKNISMALGKGDKVIIKGFGSWTVVRRNAKVVKNLFTGIEISIDAKNAVKFVPGKLLTEQVNATD